MMGRLDEARLLSGTGRRRRFRLFDLLISVKEALGTCNRPSYTDTHLDAYTGIRVGCRARCRSFDSWLHVNGQLVFQLVPCLAVDDIDRGGSRRLIILRVGVIVLAHHTRGRWGGYVMMSMDDGAEIAPSRSLYPLCDSRQLRRDHVAGGVADQVAQTGLGLPRHLSPRHWSSGNGVHQ
jgi:hypothetical protein